MAHSVSYKKMLDNGENLIVIGIEGTSDFIQGKMRDAEFDITIGWSDVWKGDKFLTVGIPRPSNSE